MKPVLDFYTGSLDAFEKWNLTDFCDRKTALTELAEFLPEKLKNVFEYQLKHAEKVVSSPRSLVSPTGETNELYTQGRGVGVIVFDTEQAESTVALVAMMSALITAGNSLIICSDNIWIKELAEKSFTLSSAPQNLIQIVSKERYADLITKDIRNFVYIGNVNRTAELSQTLAMRPNAITSMVTETDFKTLPNSKDPKLVLRFVTEKVRSINITAIGGNAMLLELGNTTH